MILLWCVYVCAGGCYRSERPGHHPPAGLLRSGQDIPDTRTRLRARLVISVGNLEITGHGQTTEIGLID